MSLKTIFQFLFAVILFTSCNELRNEVDNQLNEVKNKTNYLDSTVKDKIHKAKDIDTLIKKESENLKNLERLTN